MKVEWFEGYGGFAVLQPIPGIRAVVDLNVETNNTHWTMKIIGRSTSKHSTQALAKQAAVEALRNLLQLGLANLEDEPCTYSRPVSSLCPNLPVNQNPSAGVPNAEQNTERRSVPTARISQTNS